MIASFTRNRQNSINGVPLVFFVVGGIAQEHLADGTPDREESARENRGRFWVLHEDGQRTEIRVMRNLFTPRFGQRVWVLLYQDNGPSAPLRYAMAGHIGDGDAVRIVRESLWRSVILKTMAPQRMHYWATRVRALALSAWIVPAALVLLLTPGSLAMLTLVPGAFVCALCVAAYYRIQADKDIDGVLTPRVCGQLRDEALSLVVQSNADGPAAAPAGAVASVSAA